MEYGNSGASGASQAKADNAKKTATALWSNCSMACTSAYHLSTAANTHLVVEIRHCSGKAADVLVHRLQQPERQQQLAPAGLMLEVPAQCCEECDVYEQLPSDYMASHTGHCSHTSHEVYYTTE